MQNVEGNFVSKRHLRSHIYLLCICIGEPASECRLWAFTQAFQLVQLLVQYNAPFSDNTSIYCTFYYGLQFIVHVCYSLYHSLRVVLKGQPLFKLGARCILKQFFKFKTRGLGTYPSTTIIFTHTNPTKMNLMQSRSKRRARSWPTSNVLAVLFRLLSSRSKTSVYCTTIS